MVYIRIFPIFRQKGKGGALSKRLSLGERLSILPLLKVAIAAWGCGAKERNYSRLPLGGRVARRSRDGKEPAYVKTARMLHLRIPFCRLLLPYPRSATLCATPLIKNSPDG